MLRNSGWQPIEGGQVWVDVRHYRLMAFRRPLGPWRSSREEAVADALDKRVASRDRYSKTVFLTVPAWIWECEPNAITNAGLRARSLRLVEVADARRDQSRRR